MVFPSVAEASELIIIYDIITFHGVCGWNLKTKGTDIAELSPDSLPGKVCKSNTDWPTINSRTVVDSWCLSLRISQTG